MTPVLDPLLERLSQTREPALWIADENTPQLPPLLYSHPMVTLISNRFDLVQAAQSHELPSYFSDFDLDSVLAEHAQAQHGGPSAIFYRVSKERPVVNHVINSAYRLLPEGGRLYLTGHKNEGIKTYFSQAAKQFGESSRLQKNGDVYWGELQKRGTDGKPLDDRDYRQLRWIELADQDKFLTKPGTYGWNKIDKGSQFLMDQVKPVLKALDTSSMSLLDLGCGYGYLTLQCRQFSFRKMTATDNNAAAVECLRANAEHYELPVEVVADDCASRLAGPYDLILCNPPFHQGFTVESSLTDKFLQSCRRLMSSDARAYFVVNTFIPLEAKARKIFGGPAQRVRVLANNGQFKVIEITTA